MKPLSQENLLERLSRTLESRQSLSQALHLIGFSRARDAGITGFQESWDWSFRLSAPHQHTREPEEEPEVCKPWPNQKTWVLGTKNPIGSHSFPWDHSFPQAHQTEDLRVWKLLVVWLGIDMQSSTRILPGCCHSFVMI